MSCDCENNRYVDREDLQYILEDTEYQFYLPMICQDYKENQELKERLDKLEKEKE